MEKVDEGSTESGDLQSFFSQSQEVKEARVTLALCDFPPLQHSTAPYPPHSYLYFSTEFKNADRCISATARLP